MMTFPACDARRNLDRLMDEVAASQQPIRIAGARSNVVLVSADHWRATLETLQLLAVPGMARCIRQGMSESVDACSTSPGW